jgi:hypothetical protein
MLTSSVVVRGVKTKNYKICFIFAALPLSMQSSGVRAKTSVPRMTLQISNHNHIAFKHFYFNYLNNVCFKGKLRKTNIYLYVFPDV